MTDDHGLSKEELEVLIPLFIDSGRGYLRTFRECLQGLRGAALSGDALEPFHRSIHSLKGAAFQLGLIHIGELAQAMDASAKLAHQEGIRIPSDGCDLLERGVDLLDAYLDDLEGGGEPAQPPGELLSRLSSLAERMAGDSTRGRAVGE